LAIEAADLPDWTIPFTPGDVLALHSAVIRANLAERRRSLLAGIDPVFVAGLSKGEDFGSEILTDIHSMNSAGILVDGSAPLAIWLANAVVLADSGPQGLVLRQALERCMKALGMPLDAASSLAAAAARISASDPLDPLPPPPSPPERFTGRDDEIARIDALLGPLDAVRGASRRVAIRGIGGIGKTALALQFALHARGAFPGGTLWGHLGTERDAGERGASVNPEEILRETLLKWEAELGRVDNPARPTAALLGSVRALVAAREHRAGRCLILLDNVDTVTTLQPLLDAFPRCAVLVTTRQADLSTQPRMEIVELAGLERAASLRYAAGELVARDERVGRLASILDYIEDHPLAINLIMAALKVSPGLSPEEALVRLRKARASARPASRLGHVPRSLQDCFRVSVAAVPRSRRPLLISMASQSPLSCSLEAIDHVSGFLDLARTRERLADLAAVGLVEPVGEDRFRIHRLLRDYLRVEHRLDGFGWLLRRSWEIASLPWLLARLGGPGQGISAGIAAYDHRQEHWFLRHAQAHFADRDAIRREWDGILLGVYRRQDEEAPDASRARVAVLKNFLRGSDLSGMRLERILLDGACLDGARLEGANLSGGPLARWPRRGEMRHRLQTMFARTFGWGLVALAIAMGSLLFWELERGGMAWALFDPVLLMFVPLVMAAMLCEHVAGLFFSGGLWFDGCSRVGRLVRERLFVVITTAFVTGFSMPILLCVLDPYEASGGFLDLLVVGVGAMMPWPLFVLMAFLASSATTKLGAMGAGGIVRRSVMAVLLPLTFGITSAVLLWGFQVLFPNWAFHGTSEVELDWVLVPVLLVITATSLIFGASQDPDVGVPLYSVQTSYLRGASLVDANLRGADLRWVRLGSANLRGADLEGADLRDADLTDCDLGGANLTGARLAGTRLHGARSTETTRWPEGFHPPGERAAKTESSS
jgi:hypothetical protein